MEVEEGLLKPKYEVIANYPGSPDHNFIGHVYENCTKYMCSFFELYPHIFRKVEWHDEIKEIDPSSIISGNHLIAEFMRLKTEKTELKYHSSFDSLIPVTEHIQGIGYSVIIYGEEKSLSSYNWCKIGLNKELDIGGIQVISKIESIWLSVVEFIKFYNAKNNE